MSAGWGGGRGALLVLAGTYEPAVELLLLRREPSAAAAAHFVLMGRVAQHCGPSGDVFSRGACPLAGVTPVAESLLLLPACAEAAYGDSGAMLARSCC